MIPTVSNVFPVCDYDVHIHDKNDFAGIQFYKSNHTVFSDSDERYRHAVLKMTFDRNAGHDHSFIVSVKAQMSSMNGGGKPAHWYGVKIGAEGTNSIGLSPESIGKAAKVVKKVKAILDAYMDSIDWIEDRIVVADLFELILKGLKFKMALVPNADCVPFHDQWRGAYWTQFYAIEDLRVVKAFCQAFEIACRECMA